MAKATARVRSILGRALRMGSSRQGSGLCISPPTDPTQARGAQGQQCPRQLVAGRAKDVQWLRHVLPPAGPCSCRGDRSEVAHGHIPFLRAGGHRGDSVLPRAEHLCPKASVSVAGPAGLRCGRQQTDSRTGRQHGGGKPSLEHLPLGHGNPQDGYDPIS